MQLNRVQRSQMRLNTAQCSSKLRELPLHDRSFGATFDQRKFWCYPVAFAQPKFWSYPCTTEVLKLPLQVPSFEAKLDMPSQSGFTNSMLRWLQHGDSVYFTHVFAKYA